MAKFKLFRAGRFWLRHVCCGKTTGMRAVYGNAFYAATGVRIKDLTLLPHRRS